MALSPLSRYDFQGIQDVDVAAAAGFFYEGVPLVHTMEGSKAVVAAATGGAGEVFAGIAYKYLESPPSITRVIDGVVPASAPYTITTPYGTLTGTTIYAIASGSGEDAVLGSVVTPSGVSGAVITFNAGDAGTNVRIFATVALTGLQSAMLFPAGAGGPAGVVETYKRASVATRGDIWTSAWDPTVSWVAATINNLSLGAGVFTRGGSGAALPPSRIQVIGAPTPEHPFLGVRLL